MYIYIYIYIHMYSVITNIILPLYKPFGAEDAPGVKELARVLELSEAPRESAVADTRPRDLGELGVRSTLSVLPPRDDWEC